MLQPASFNSSSLPAGKTSHLFTRAVLRYVLRGGLFTQDSHLPPTAHDIPQDFSGICVATGDDPAIDDFVIACLHELGVARVRLDFSYGDAVRPPGRLLQALMAQPFEIMLHLVQPREAAKRMDSEAAREEWRSFVAETLDRYGSRVWAVEIGATVNRRRWAGYTLNGLLSAWGIAFEEAKKRNLRLAGPNITDFEPIYNIGLLSLLQARGQLPDSHTNNLFSERSTEPERYDHKIVGRRHASRIRVNLVKKAFLLNKIGRDHGVADLYSPAAFWTLPRIGRVLAHGEQKQADYLARYMLLCAASGALKGAAWGPLVCHREGLVDDGHVTYPALERITHYAYLQGLLGDYRIRPAFRAYRTFNQLIPGMHYEGPVSTAEGLEVHVFTSPTRRLHAAWTNNGHAAAIEDIYSQDDLQAAICLDRDGVQLEVVPHLVTESPLYLHWPAEYPTHVRPGADILEKVVIDRHAEGVSHYLFRDAGWQGLIQAADAQQAALIMSQLHPDRIDSPPRDALLRKARNIVWSVADPRNPQAKLVIKQPLRMHLHKRLLDRFKPSKGKRSWNGTQQLLRRGIEAAPPVAYFEKTDSSGLMRNYYICQFVQTDFTARQLFIAFAEGAHEYMEIGELEAYRQLSQYLLRMHGRGVHFRDLSGGNVLIRKQEDGMLAFSLIDTNRARFYDHPVSMRMRISDLTRICNKLHWKGRFRFMQMYLQPLRREFNFLTRLSFHLYDFKVGFKRHFGRKGMRKFMRWTMGKQKPAL